MMIWVSPQQVYVMVLFFKDNKLRGINSGVNLNTEKVAEYEFNH
jgi:hypothetical protein